MGIFWDSDTPTAPSVQDPLANLNFGDRLLLGLGGPDAVNDTKKMNLQLAQQAALQDIAGQMQSGQLTKPQALVEYARRTGDFSHFFQQDTTPAAIQEYNFVKALDPDQQALYFRNKRANQLIDTGDKQLVVGANGQPVTTYTKQLAPGEQPEVRGAQAAAAAQGQAAGTAAAAAPAGQAAADQMLKNIDDVLNDPEGIKAITGGMFGLKGLQSETLPLSAEQRAMQPKIDQLKGQAFLQAYNSLRGAGQITEVEGEKATNAMGRLKQSQDPKDFTDALQDLRDVVAAAKDRLGKAGSNVRSANPASGGKAGGPKVIDFGAL